VKHDKRVWYYAVDGEKKGPFTDSELKHLANTGILQRDMLIWTSGLQEWKPADSVRGLFTVEAPIPQPPPLSEITSQANVPSPVSSPKRGVPSTVNKDLTSESFDIPVDLKERWRQRYSPNEKELRGSIGVLAKTGPSGITVGRDLVHRSRKRSLS
jgi:hypothetical protein